MRSPTLAEASISIREKYTKGFDCDIRIELAVKTKGLTPKNDRFTPRGRPGSRRVPPNYRSQRVRDIVEKKSGKGRFGPAT